MIAQNTNQEEVLLTKFSHGAGCGCKIAPSVLDKILHSTRPKTPDPKLLVGNETRDDAAVYDLGNGFGLISTTDFFMPIVDDAFDFGRIASANAISDVYAMGGTPTLAIAILGWPVGKIDEHVAAQVLEGSRQICSDAGISLAGGHSIDSPEPIFGLAVNGLVPIPNLKRNNTAREGDLLFLTKPIGIGAISTAQKKGMVKPDDLKRIVHLMTCLNRAGETFGRMPWVHAMTDVTGFGLLGHLSEMCEGSNLSAEIWFDAVPKIENAEEYIASGCVPGGTNRNWASYGHRFGEIEEQKRLLLSDPQTSGGLLIAVDPAFEPELYKLKSTIEIYTELKPIGRLLKPGSKISVK